jgi:WD40 repeat protein
MFGTSSVILPLTSRAASMKKHLTSCLFAILVATFTSTVFSELAVAQPSDIRWIRGGWHEGGIHASAVSPNGTLIATAGADGTIKLWDVAAGRLLDSLTGHGRDVTSVAFLPDGNTLVSAGLDGTVRFWHISTGENIRTLVDSTGGILHLQITSDDHLIIADHADGSVTVWDASSWTIVRRFQTDASSSTAFLLARGDSLLATQEEGRDDAQVWNINTGRLKGTYRQYSYMRLVGFSPDGSKLLSIGEYDSLKVWDLSTDSLIAAYADTSLAYSRAIIFSSSGDSLFVLVKNYQDQLSTIRVWDLLERRMVRMYSIDEPTLSVTRDPWMAFLPNAHCLLVSGIWLHGAPNEVQDPVLYRLDFEPVERVTTFVNPVTSVDEVVFLPDGNAALTTSWGNLRQWRTEDGASMSRIETGENAERIQFAPDGTCMTVFYQDPETIIPGPLDLRSTTNKAVIHTIVQFNPGHGFPSAGGRYVFFHDEQSRLMLWDSTTLSSKPLGISPCAPWLFSFDANHIASTCSDKSLRLWNIQTETFDRSMPLPLLPTVLAFSRNDVFIATGDPSGTIRVWETATGNLAATLSGHTRSITSLVFSHNGRFIVSASADSTIRIWKLSTQTAEYIYREHPAVPLAVDVSPDGKSIVAGTSDGRVIMYDARGEMASSDEDRSVTLASNMTLHVEPNFLHEHATATLLLDLPISNFVSIKLFDQMGNEVRAIAAEHFSAGQHQLRVNAAGLPAGVYYVRAIAGEHVAAAKIVVVK